MKTHSQDQLEEKGGFYLIYKIFYLRNGRDPQNSQKKDFSFAIEKLDCSSDRDNVFERLCNAFPNQAHTMIHRSRNLIKTNNEDPDNYEKALDIIEKALKIKNVDYSCWHMKGFIHYQYMKGLLNQINQKIKTTLKYIPNPENKKLDRFFREHLRVKNLEDSSFLQVSYYLNETQKTVFEKMEKKILQGYSEQVNIWALILSLVKNDFIEEFSIIDKVVSYYLG